MTTTTTGRFVWHELHTGDRAKAHEVLRTAPGMGDEGGPDGSGRHTACACTTARTWPESSTSKAPANVPPHWLPYIAVEDVDASAKQAKDLGGKILGAPMDIPNVGRFAVVADPQGATFAIYKGAKPYPEEQTPPPVGAFCWEELSTSDPEAAAKFYAALFGYTIESVDMGPMGTYRILKSGDRQRAGIMKSMPQGPQQPHWLEYVAVKDVDAATRNAKELGAKTLFGPQDIPNVGRFSVIADPTGAAIALFKGA